MISNLFSSKGSMVLARVFTAGIVMSTVLAGGIAHAATSMVWSQDDGPAINVYYSPNGIRVIPVTTAGVHVSPNLFRAQDTTWVTWIDKSEPEISRLRFALLSERGAILEAGIVPTQTSHIYAPAISVDPSGSSAWLVWAESNGRRENLYASFRDIKHKHSVGWQKALQITPDSQYSANIPIINATLVDQIRISWVRTSPVSSESASIVIMSDDWKDRQAALRDDGISTPREASQRALTLRKNANLDAFAKMLKQGQPRSQDERQWEILTNNNKALMGAIHSGSGPSKRLAKEVKLQ